MQFIQQQHRAHISASCPRGKAASVCPNSEPSSSSVPLLTQSLFLEWFSPGSKHRTFSNKEWGFSFLSSSHHASLGKKAANSLHLFFFFPASYNSCNLWVYHGQLSSSEQIYFFFIFFPSEEIFMAWIKDYVYNMPLVGELWKDFHFFFLFPFKKCAYMYVYMGYIAKFRLHSQCISFQF